jgi:Carboxypeptidase regulatory-like domain
MGLRRFLQSAAHIIVFGAVLYSFSSTAVGQQKSGSVSGQVVGLSGEELSGAPIQAKNMESGQTFKTTSTLNGSYSFTDLPAGKYEISSLVDGFERRSVDVRAGETIRIDIHFVELTNTLGTVGEIDVVASRIAAYNKPKPPLGATPRTPSGKPDLSGYWRLMRVTGDMPQMQRWAAALAKYRADNVNKDSPSARCLPGSPVGFDQLIQTPMYLIVLFELDSYHHLIFLDGRDHPKDLDPTWYGHSVGNWDGDVLLIDRVGFNERTWLPEGLPHTDSLHIVHRVRRPDLGHLEMETTIEDSGAYLRPWTRKVVFELQPNQEVHEYVCNENNLDLVNMIGK